MRCGRPSAQEGVELDTQSELDRKLHGPSLDRVTQVPAGADLDRTAMLQPGPGTRVLYRTANFVHTKLVLRSMPGGERRRRVRAAARARPELDQLDGNRLDNDLTF
eukprot:SAG31_NODE_236_length_19594_cov_7.018620_6_plen_106_part_00